MQLLRKSLEVASIALFAVLLLVWLAKLAFVIWATSKHGISGFQDAIVHGTALPRNPKDWGRPNWSAVATQYGILALLTFLLGFINRETLKKVSGDIRRAVRNRSNEPE